MTGDHWVVASSPCAEDSHNLAIGFFPFASIEVVIRYRMHSCNSDVTLAM